MDPKLEDYGKVYKGYLFFKTKLIVSEQKVVPALMLTTTIVYFGIAAFVVVLL